MYHASSFVKYHKGSFIFTHHVGLSRGRLVAGTSYSTRVEFNDTMHAHIAIASYVIPDELVSYLTSYSLMQPAREGSNINLLPIACSIVIQDLTFSAGRLSCSS